MELIDKFAKVGVKIIDGGKMDRKFPEVKMLVVG